MADPADMVVEPVKKQLIKLFNSPSYYVALFTSLFLSVLLIHSFVRTIGPAGVNPHSDQFFGLINNILVSAFGQSFVDHLFSQGPFSLVFIVASLPLLVFLMFNAISQFASWLSPGTEDLDFNKIAIFALNHIFATLISLSLLLLFFTMVSGFTNLVLGNIFFIELVFSFFVLFGFWSYWFFIFVLLRNKKWCTLLSFLIMLLFIFMAIVDYMILDDSLTFFPKIINFPIQWISPVNYFSKFITAIYYNQRFSAFAFSFLLVILIIVVNLASLFLLKRKLIKDEK